jgi:hypothetical protein
VDPFDTQTDFNPFLLRGLSAENQAKVP